MEIDEPQSWKNWTLARFRKHETENETRRAVEIDEASDDKEPPRPGREGWRHHPRRGLVGAVSRTGLKAASGRSRLCSLSSQLNLDTKT